MQTEIGYQSKPLCEVNRHVGGITSLHVYSLKPRSRERSGVGTHQALCEEDDAKTHASNYTERKQARFVSTIISGAVVRWPRSETSAPQTQERSVMGKQLRMRRTCLERAQLQTDIGIHRGSSLKVSETVQNKKNQKSTT